jgi:hypothetical protein
VEAPEASDDAGCEVVDLDAFREAHEEEELALALAEASGKGFSLPCARRFDGEIYTTQPPAGS